MLFVIDRSIREALERPDTEQEIIGAVDLLAHAYRYGLHLIFAEPSILEYLSISPKISPAANSVFQHIYSRFPQIGNYQNIFLFRIEVVSGDGILHLQNINDRKVIQISAQFINPSIINSTMLLSENLNDVRLYEIIGRVFVIRSNIGNVNLNFEASLGGGSTVSEYYQGIQSEGNRLCLCILDSDKTNPESKYGDTAQRTLNVDDPKQPLCHLVILESREVENIIPVPVLQEVVTGDAKRVGALYFLERLKHYEGLNCKMYLDYKNGIRVFDIRESDHKSEYYKYWASNLKTIGIPLQCQAAAECESRQECTCIVFNGFGEKNLYLTLDYLAKVTIHKINEFVDDTVRDEWDMLGEIVLSWGCASQQISYI